MSKRINIDSEKCVGCGICARTCQQSAIEMVNGKAMVTKRDSCDKIGNCLPVCPVNAITFVEDNNITPNSKPFTESKCYGSLNYDLKKEINITSNKASVIDTTDLNVCSQLKQWPVQIKLVLDNASFFDNADLLIAADCSAYAYANFHNDFMNNKVTIIGCPKLDMVDYTEKLTNIFANNNIKSIQTVRMQVPCCGGIENATRKALQASGKELSCEIVTLSTDGKIVN